MLTRFRRAARALAGLRAWPDPTLPTPKDLEQQVYSALIEPGDCIYDVGANVGDVALYLARRAGLHGTVYAFEPVASSFRKLCRAVQDDDHEKAPVIPLLLGLSDRQGTATIAFPQGECGYASLARINAWSHVSRASVEEHTCALMPLDAVVEQWKLLPPQLLKVDVEGAELPVFRGACEVLRKARPLILAEILAPWEVHFGYGPADVLGFLKELGYRFLFICPEGLVEHEPTAQQPFPPPFVRGYNVVAYQEDLHPAAVQRLAPLRFGSPGVLPMQPAPVPNAIGAVS